MRKMKDSGIEWIGEIPEYWECTQFKTLLSRNDGGVWGNDPTDTDVDKIVIRSTEQTIDGKWCINNPAKRDLTTENIKDYRIVKNDLLMTKSSGSLDHIGKTSIADEYFTKNECYYSNFIQRLRCYENKYFPKYAWFILNSTIARKQFAYLQNSTSGLGNINSGIINQIKVPLPPLPDQQRIANFLDEKVSQIDSTISKTRESIEEYKKLKQAIITEAVTKGLNPNAKMKNSGIEWIGEIPEEWECFYLSQIFTPVKNKNIGLLENNLLSLSYGKIIRKNIETTFGLLPENFEGYNIIQENDIVLRLTDLQNDHKSLRVGIAKEKGIITSAYLTLRNQTNKIAKYFYYLLHSFDIAKGFYGMGAGVRQGLNWNEVRSLRMIAPKDISEQQQIADYLDQKCSEIDNLITKKEQLVVELEAYKKSLIYEVVTGKREV
ncbi:MAG: restriction endonuclease subunit S [Spirochaetaceae bacterium]|nr:restriction endonuclease subunit S [Spirochaetaceae bacterium]